MLSLARWTTLSIALAVLLSIGVSRSTAQPVIVERPAVTYYAPPAVVAPAPVTVTTYRYGLLPGRLVVRSYVVPPVAPVVAYEPRVVVRRPLRVVRYYTPVYPYP
jgi:hypothetical protein